MVLFCDVVGSTERLTRLGDEAGDEFRRRVFAELRRCVTESKGTEVKNRATASWSCSSAAPSARSSVPARCTPRPAHIDLDDPVHLRVGISVGEVAHEDDDWFGTPVVEAARLCSAAGSDQTLAPALLASVVGSRGRAHRFRSLGTMTLKGLAGPMQVVEVDGDPRSDGTEPAAVVHVDPSGHDPVVASSRRRRWVAPVAAVVAVLLVVAAVLVRSRGDGVEDAASGSPTTVPLGDEVTSPVGYTPELEPTDCPPDVVAAVPGATCGDLVVPEFRGAPDGASPSGSRSWRSRRRRPRSRPIRW